MAKANKKRTLIQAVKSKYLKMVQKLLDHGANIDIQDEQGETPLFTACRDRQDEIALELMERGADVNMKTFEGVVVLSVAIGKKKVEMTRKLLEFRANPNDYHLHDTLLMMALSEGNIKIVILLLQYGAEVTRGALLYVIMCNSPKIVQMMLNHGADLKVFDILQLIISRGDLEVLKMFIKHGVDLNRYTRIHCVPLHYAITATVFPRNAINRIGIVSELLKNGANPYLPDYIGNTPIHRATKFPCAMKVFLKEGGFLDLNIRNKN